VPSLKNSKQLFTNPKTGKTFITSSTRAKEWFVDAHWQLKGKSPVSAYPVAITMIFYFKNNRKHDLDNVCSTVLDGIKKAGIIEDDSYEHVCPITLDFGGVDKTDPRVEIYIDEP
jgi:Holliday junction resolvase RusA-like endonuclease